MSSRVMNPNRLRIVEGAEVWIVMYPITKGRIRIPRDGRWTFNDDFEHPTLTPSVNITETLPEGVSRNHFYITEGCIHYLADCTHAQAGKVVDLPTFPVPKLNFARDLPGKEALFDEPQLQETPSPAAR